MTISIPIPLAVFLLVLARWGVLAALVPTSELLPLPFRLRLAGAALISLLLTPVHLVAVETQPPVLEFAWMLGHELFIGLAIGTALLVVLEGLKLAGQLISQLAGISLRGTLTLGAEAGSSPHGRLILLCSLAALLAVGGHRQLVEASLESYQHLPPGTPLATQDALVTVTRLLSVSFLMALRISLPVVTALLVGLITAGWISRLLPQLNMIVLGWHLNAVLALAMILLTLGGMAWVFQRHVQLAVEYLGQLWTPT
jgi:flagellar biosynthetic protein FliR